MAVKKKTEKGLPDTVPDAVVITSASGLFFFSYEKDI